MSLQFELVQQFIEVKASSVELNRILDAAKTALSRQDKLVEDNLSKIWAELWNSWTATYTGEIKLSITRVNYFHMVYYRVLAGVTMYSLHFERNGTLRIEIMYSDRDKCRIIMASDGTHDGCCRDGCDEFDSLVGDPENVRCLLDFRTNIHLKMVEAAIRLQNERL